MNDILVFNIARLAVKSMLNAGAAWPKPGLVTPLADAAGRFKRSSRVPLGSSPVSSTAPPSGLRRRR